MTSSAWLRRFRFGPLEWLWRSLTYGRAPALRRSQAGKSAAFLGCVCVTLLVAPPRAGAGVELGVGWEGNVTRGSAFTSSGWAFEGGPGSAIVLRATEGVFYYRLNDGVEETRVSSWGGLEFPEFSGQFR